MLQIPPLGVYVYLRKYLHMLFFILSELSLTSIGCFCSRYNARDGKWLQISSMNVPRTYFSLVALEDCLLAVGGKHNRVAVSSAEKYTFSTNEWTSVASLPNTLFSHAGNIKKDRTQKYFYYSVLSVILISANIVTFFLSAHRNVT